MASVLRFEAPDHRLVPSLEAATRTATVSLNPDALAATVMYDRPRPSGATIYREIAERGEDVPLVELSVAPPRDIREAEVAMRRALEDVVAAAMAGAKNVAVLAGGGVDSSALLALAHRHARKTGVRVFAVALDFETDGDDRPHLAVLERHLRCEVHRVTPEDGAAFVSSLDRGIDAAPFNWPTGCLELSLEHRAKQEGAEVLLSGVGGDELFDGIPQRLGGAFLRRPLETLRAARALRGFVEPRQRWYDWVLRPAVLPFVPRRLRAFRSRLRRLEAPPWAGPRLRAHVREAERERLARRLDDRTVGLGPWDAEHHHLMATLYHQCDSAAGLVSRRPFLERPLRRLVRGFDPIWLLADDVRRGLFRRVIRDLVPESIAARVDKAEFGPACRRLIRAIGGHERFRPLASVERLASLGVVDAERFAPAFRAFEGRLDVTDDSVYVWSALAVESFLRHRERVS